MSIKSVCSTYTVHKHLHAYLRAWKCVETLLQIITDKRNEENYEKLYQKCKIFAKKINNFFIDNPLVELQENFDSKRVSIKMKKSGELSQDETRILTPFQKNKTIYFQILDTVKMSISERFIPNKDLLLDISWLDPAKYKEITLISFEDFPLNALKQLSVLAGIDRNLFLLNLNNLLNNIKTFLPLGDLYTMRLMM